MKWLTGISVLICAFSSCAGAEREEVFITQMSRVSDEAALKDLPPHLKPEPGKPSLLADFQNQKEGRVTLYYVNATKKPILLPKQDGDMYCKREARAKDGEWRRCDSHEYSWCGNSYGYVEVKAGRFISWEQKLDSKDGEPRPVRFRLFNGDLAELESNEGMGRITDADMRFCRYDSMAMSYGPFEDVAAVATGEVKGSQGSSMGGNSGIASLERFSSDERLFPVLKKVIASLLKQANSKNLRPDDDESRLRVLGLDNEYEACLKALAKTIGRTTSPEKAWVYVVGQVNDLKFPWGGVALDWLVHQFEGRWREEKILAEKLLSQPDHPAFGAALGVYAKLAEKDEAGLRLDAISNDKRYSNGARGRAREIREELFPNPYLRVSIEHGEPFAKTLQPLKSVTIANISPQTLTLPVDKAEDLIFVHMAGNDAVGNQMPVAGSGQLHLKPGEKIVLHEVAWWHGIDPAKVNQSEKGPFGDEKKSLSFIFHAATPGLWDIPANAGSWISVDQDKLLEALENKP